MPLASPEQYRQMLDSARRGGYALPAYNVSSLEMLTAVLEGLTDAQSDGIIAISVSASRFLSGPTVNDCVLGAQTFAEFAHRVADRYPVLVALHTDHCGADDLDRFVVPLLAITEERRRCGLPPLFNSHMWDGSALSLQDNLDIAQPLLARCAAVDVLLEIEVGVIGGEREGLSADHPDRLYSTPEDFLAVVDRLGAGAQGRYLVAATFGNVHGIYKPGNVKLDPQVLRRGQEVVRQRTGGKDFDLVFHGGSGSGLDSIHEAIDHGVVKMNISTEAEYCYTRPVVDHMMRNYNGVLMIDGEVGEKKAYDPRKYLRKAQDGLSARVARSCVELKSAGSALLIKASIE
ncbi:class II fructose-bisphosphate aldolase [Kribbella sp. NPDC056345]|uniref:class II fructose-bisphosphate aldolase n=1 Tax=Kribbella sp. NPDC056345 TaxID=3345789 RepID=UPI0035DC7EF1